MNNHGGSSGSNTNTMFMALGCMAFVFVLLTGMGGAVYFYLGAAPEPPKKKKPRKVKAEVIKYKSVKDRRTGPSSVRPSGKSGRSLKTKGGVIKQDSKEIILAVDINAPKKPKFCNKKSRVTDFIKDVAFDIDKEMRKTDTLSAKEEMALGKKIDREIQRHPSFRGRIDTPDTKRWRAYLARVAQPLLAEIGRKKITYQFHVIDSPTVNAFAIPGGHIYFFTGLLQNNGGDWLSNEAQLAGILAHEISHVDLGHCAAVFQYLKKIGIDDDDSEVPASLILTLARGAFSSNQEDEADDNATRILYTAQYAPDEFARMWLTWARIQDEDKPEEPKSFLDKELDNLLRSHSDSRVRACNVMKLTRKVLKKKRFDRFYIGQTNLKKRRARTREQF